MLPAVLLLASTYRPVDPPLRPHVALAAVACPCMSSGDHYEDSVELDQAFGVRADVGAHLVGGVHLAVRGAHESFSGTRDATVTMLGAALSHRWGRRVRPGFTFAYGVARSHEVYRDRVLIGRFLDISFDLAIRPRSDDDPFEIFIETTILSGRSFQYPEPVDWGFTKKEGWGYGVIPPFAGFAAGLRWTI